MYQSTSANINTIADCETNGTLLNTGGTVNITDYTVLGLTPNTTYFFNVVVADMAGNRAAYNTKELKTLTTGIASAELSNQINVYPNPTTGQLQITNYELRIDNVEIFDVMGQSVTVETWHAASLQPTTTLNISHFPTGTYFIRIITEKGMITKKVIKQ